MPSRDWTTPYRETIEDCRESGRISSWEADFLDSIEERLDESTPLTEKQIETLDNIFFKVKG